MVLGAASRTNPRTVARWDRSARASIRRGAHQEIRTKLLRFCICCDPHDDVVWIVTFLRGQLNDRLAVDGRLLRRTITCTMMVWMRTYLGVVEQRALCR